ncbi:MAG: hypothetical protein KGM44_06235 [bacterium]|nr:hypothetical protein [bacterium]
MTRFFAAMILSATVLGLAACSGGSTTLPPSPSAVQSHNPDGGLLPPNH